MPETMAAQSDFRTKEAVRSPPRKPAILAVPVPIRVAAARKSAAEVSQLSTAERRCPRSRSVSRAVARVSQAQTGPATISAATDQRIAPAERVAGASGSCSQLSIRAKPRSTRLKAMMSRVRKATPWRRASRALTTVRGRGTGGSGPASTQASRAAAVSGPDQPALRAAAAMELRSWPRARASRT